MMHSSEYPRVNILGVGVSAINLDMAIKSIDNWIQKQESHYICVRDVHGVMESQRDREICHIHNHAGLVTPDGMPLVWLCRLKGHAYVERVYGPDLMLALCEHSLHKGYRHYFYGGVEGVPELLAQRLRQRFPGLQIVGTISPPFQPLTEEEDIEIVKEINQQSPHVIWVGLSTPKQEYWMASHIGKINAPVFIGVGAAFDFLAGIKKQAPRWMQRSGLEWLFRLGMEPGRLWRRYLINAPIFIVFVLLQSLGLRKYPLDHG
jgi:N-acetylglucosaminyldiphosphoundecaprenol N-acetyl-beta-D-mannosaminyltransferase